MHGETKVSLAHIHVFHMHIYAKRRGFCTSVPFIKIATIIILFSAVASAPVITLLESTTLNAVRVDWTQPNPARVEKFDVLILVH